VWGSAEQRASFTLNRGPRPIFGSCAIVVALGMEYTLEFLSTSLGIALVALGLLLVQRSHGIAVLETVPLATGLGLFFLGSLRPDSSSTLYIPTLILPTAGCALAIIVLEPLYVRWRLRVAGESTTLILSFAVMNCCLLAMSISTDSRSVPLGLADSHFIRTTSRLEWMVIALSAVVLVGTIFYLRYTRLVAALQLSKDDHRLLATFGRDSKKVRRHVLALAVVLCTVGASLYISLQETFAVSNSYAILVPGFAIAISQSRIRVIRLLAAGFFLVAVGELFTHYTSELLRDFHRAVLFSFFVFVGVGSRKAHDTGILLAWRRRLVQLARGALC
jgi:branched-subunit amino acid ABC-type transport system permease component